MKDREEKKAPASGKKYVRRIALDDLDGWKKRDARSKVMAKEPEERSGGTALCLTVRGLRHGAVSMEAQDGTVYTASKDSARGTLWGDVVQAEVIGRERVRVVRVLNRAHQTIIGVLREKRGVRYIIPLERRLPQGIAVRPGSDHAKDGDIVTTRVVRWEDEGGLLVRIDGRIGSFSQTSCALNALIAASRLRTDFPAQALEQAKACAEARLEDDPDRTDMRDMLSFTIDGLDAKDFDDAVSLETLPHGAVRLGVHIADVGYYVPQGSALDREAWQRGTSVYFPGRVLPMLPEQLSNGVCSLRPDEDKFTLSALMDIGPDGEVTEMRLLRTITRSKARLVYEDVNALFESGRAHGSVPEELVDSLLAMRALARRIRTRRETMGAIDFDASEPKFVLDEQGEPAEIVMRERGEAEMMIEDFMLTANACVAQFAKEKGVPLLYRVHEKPDPEKLDTLREFLQGLGVDARAIRGRAKPGDIRAVLEQAKDTPEYSVISTLALRSMQKARYDVSPLGHYGLAMPDYCHFTSPIRRYPDLIVSRALSAVLKGGRVTLSGDALADAAMRSSDCERAAVEAERAADKLMTARYMKGHLGELFDGTVSGVSEWGVYVLLTNGAEGFVHVRSLEDWFDYDERRMTLRGERTGFVFSLGQQLCVRVQSVELESCAVDLELAQPLQREKREKSARKKERERMRAFRR